MSETPDPRPPIWTGHLVLYGRDPRRSGAFYEKIGFRPVGIMDPFAVMELAKERNKRVPGTFLPGKKEFWEQAKAAQPE